MGVTRHCTPRMEEIIHSTECTLTEECVNSGKTLLLGENMEKLEAKNQQIKEKEWAVELCQTGSHWENKNLYRYPKPEETNHYRECVILMMGRTGDAQGLDMVIQPKD